MSRLRFFTSRLFDGKLNVGKNYICRRYESGKIEPPPMENPILKTGRILKRDLERFFGGKIGSEYALPSHCDVLIIGGGIMGSSAAYWLQKRAPHKFDVVVVDKDLSVMSNESHPVQFSKASTVLSVGGIRQQFSLRENIEMSLFGAEFLRNIKKHLFVEGFDPPDIQFTPTGYLFLATDKGAEQLEENARFQWELGASSELLGPMKLKERFPWLNTEGIALGCHGLRDEGWFDPWSLLNAFKRKAMSLGTQYVNGEAVAFEFVNRPDMFMDGVELGQYDTVDKLLIRLPSGEIHAIKFGICIIAAGAFSGQVAKMARIGNGPGMLSIPLPIEPRKRFVYFFHCPDGPGLQSPLMIDPTGTYFRREGVAGNYIGGKAPDPEDEPSVDNLDVDHDYFTEKVWPHLAHRVKAFENIKVKSSWAGFYEYNTYDENGVVSPHPYYHNLYIASGFSGHGIQHGPAVGRAIMEMIVDGGFMTIDLSRMSFDRFITEQPLLEKNCW